MMRRLMFVAGALTLFLGVLAWSFPIEPIVRRELNGLRGPNGEALTFGQAYLVPVAIRLTNVRVADTTGRELASLPALDVRPSLVGLWRGNQGFPLHLAADQCGGRVHAEVPAPTAPSTVVLTWRGVQLEGCALTRNAPGVQGGSDGEATLALTPAGIVGGEGVVNLTGAVVEMPPGPFASMGPLHANAATLHWHLSDGVVQIDPLELHGPEIDAHGQGQVRLGVPLAASALELRIDIAPKPAAPGALHFALALLPPVRAGSPERQLQLSGSLGAPRLGPSR